MKNKRLLRTLIVAISIFSAFFLQTSLLSEHVRAAGTAPDVRMTTRITDLPFAITVTPSPVEFPNTPDGTTSQIMVTIRNTSSTGTYELSEPELISPSFIVDLTVPQQLPPHTETQFAVYFRPIDQGYFEATLYIRAYGAGTIATIPLSGFGTPAPGINVSPWSAAFGNQTVGVPSLNPVTITVTNSGSASLSLASLSVNGGNASDFPVQGFPIAPIPAYTQTTFIVGFTPSTEGPRSATLDFSTNVSGTPTVSIPLSGTGVNGPPAPNPGGTTSFTYQGKLVEAGANVSTPRDLKFKLFDDENDVQIGSDVIVPGVSFRDGIFTTVLDFGANPFTGAPRSLEISVSQPGANVFTALSPRQPVTSTPYAVRSLNAVNAENATNTQQLGGIPANQYVSTVDPRMTDPRDPTAGSANYVQNQNTSPQALANFSIDGTGSANVLNAATQFNLGGNRILATPASESLAVGLNAGAGSLSSKSTMVGTNSGSSGSTGIANSFFGNQSGLYNTTGAANSFFGNAAGRSNSTGQLNAYFGGGAGSNGTTGSSNSFFGENTGLTNTTGSNLTLVGSLASVGADGLSYATAIGAGSAVSTSNTLVLGRPADTVNVPGSFNTSGTFTSNVVNSQTRYNIGGSNALSFGNSIEDLHVGGDSPANTGIGQTFVGRFAGFSNTSGGANSFLGSEAGRNNTTGGNNTFVGQLAGLDNIGGNWNTFIGQAAGHHNLTGFSNTFIGQASGTQNTSSTHATLLGANTSTVDGLDYATAIGAGATVTSSNTVALGRTADSIWIPGHLYLNQLGPATATRLCWNSSNYQISTCSTPLAGTSDLTEFNGEQVPTVLVDAIKEQQTLIDAQAKQIEELKKLVCSMNPTAEVCSKIAPTK